MDPGITAADVMALIWAMRGLVQAGEVALPDWQRFLDIRLLRDCSMFALLRRVPGVAGSPSRW